MRVGALAFMGFVVSSALHQAAAKPPVPIQHVIIIMQENRSFDSYFGTYPGARGLQGRICEPLDPANPQRGCVEPFHDQHEVNGGGPHGAVAAVGDLDDGLTQAKMDGFVYQQSLHSKGCTYTGPRVCPGALRHDVMGYHTDEEIPNYWAYAKNFVLQDQLYEGMRAWSWSSHVEMTSEWAAICKDQNDVSTCKSAPNLPRPNSKTVLPWANFFLLLDTHGVSWKYYLDAGNVPDCDDELLECPPAPQQPRVPSIWNPTPFYATVKNLGQNYIAVHNPGLDQFYLDVQNGTLPQVSWIVPSSEASEHPPESVTQGMDYVTALVNTVMSSPYWQNTAIFLAWDDWGGFYDHITPPVVDLNTTKTPVQGYGLRVPGLLISAWAKQGMIDHHLLSFDAYNRFIEDLFMDGARLDPAQLGIPDSRPDIRDALTSVTDFKTGEPEPIGDLMDEFDFKQAPLPPVVLSVYVPHRVAADCNEGPDGVCRSQMVGISWRPVAGGNIKGPFTYHVLRDGTEVPGCVTEDTHCSDVPGPGLHYYRVYSVDSAGRASPPSGAADANEPS